MSNKKGSKYPLSVSRALHWPFYFEPVSFSSLPALRIGKSNFGYLLFSFFHCQVHRWQNNSKGVQTIMASMELPEQALPEQDNSSVSDSSDAPVVDATPTFPPLSSTYSHVDDHYVKMEDGDANDQIVRSSNSQSLSIANSVMTADGLADPIGFLIICCVVLIGDMNRGVVFPIMWPLVQELGGDAVWLGYAVGAFSFGRIIASPTLGKWSVQYGYSKTLIGSTATMLIACLLFAQVHRVNSVYYLIFTQTMLGVGSATLGVTRAFVAEITATRQRTGYIALLTAVQYGGFTVTPLFGALLMYALQENSYEFGFIVFDQYSAAAYFMALLSAATLAVLMTKFKNRIRTKQNKRKKSSRTTERDELADRTTSCGITVYDAALLGCMLLNVSTKGSIASFETLGIRFAESYFGLEPETAGMIVSLNGMVGVVALLSMSQLGKFFTDIQMIIGGMTVCAIGIIGFSTLQGVEDGAYNPTWKYFVGIFMIYGVGYPIGHTAVIGLFSKIVGRKAQGTLQGWFASAGSLARILFPIMSGYIAQFDDITTVFKVLFGILALSNFFVAVSSPTLTALAT